MAQALIKKPEIKTHHFKWSPSLILIAAILIFISHVIFSTYPAWRTNQTTAQELENIKNLISVKTKQLALAIEENTNLNPTDEEMLRETQIPANGDTTNLLRYLEKITPYDSVSDAQKIDLKSIGVSSISVSKQEATASKIVQMRINISFTSSPSAFRQLIKELERSTKRIFTINDISLSESNIGPLPQRGKYTLSMIAYNQQQETSK